MPSATTRAYMRVYSLKLPTPQKYQAHMANCWSLHFKFFAQKNKNAKQEYKTVGVALIAVLLSLYFAEV
jgi:hypothetical protein